MSLSVLILRLDPLHLRVLSAFGFVSGLVAILFAFRKQQTSRHLHPLPDRKVQDEMLDPAARPASPEPDPVPQVIRLSLPSIAARSTEMTQQEKVAAALMRAGFVNPASWNEPSSPAQVAEPSTSTAIAEPPQPPRKFVVAPSQPASQPRSTAARKLLLLVGVVLALISAYFFIRAH